MGQPSVVSGDKIVGTCPNHVVPGPGNAPVPVPAMPFSAPLKAKLAKTVTIGGKKAVVQGSSGRNQPAHPGLHSGDPFSPGKKPQQGQVVKGSSTVFFDGQPAAYTGCQVTICVAPGMVTGTGTTVEIGP